MVVIAPDSSTDPVLTKIEKSIKDANASDLKIERLGKKTLAYPIAKQTEGEYIVFNFEAPPEVTNAISQLLRLEREAILRYLLIRSPKASKAAKVIKGPKEPEVAKAKEKRKIIVEGTKAKVTVTTKPAIKTATKITKGKRKKVDN